MVNESLARHLNSIGALAKEPDFGSYEKAAPKKKRTTKAKKK